MRLARVITLTIATALLLAPAASAQISTTELKQTAEPFGDPDRSGASHKIVGGGTTSIASFPFQVAILNDGVTDVQFCGGSLIRPRIVLT
ncbi:MAG: trypsin-like serine protease, partial [Actinobacteria bacterium]|nr:trypsin-like serine protease [Actinomycetota bacterium]